MLEKKTSDISISGKKIERNYQTNPYGDASIQYSFFKRCSTPSSMWLFRTMISVGMATVIISILTKYVSKSDCQLEESIHPLVTLAAVSLLALSWHKLLAFGMKKNKYLCCQDNQRTGEIPASFPFDNVEITRHPVFRKNCLLAIKDTTKTVLSAGSSLSIYGLTSILSNDKMNCRLGNEIPSWLTFILTALIAICCNDAIEYGIKKRLRDHNQRALRYLDDDRGSYKFIKRHNINNSDQINETSHILENKF